jgi:acetyl-CoA/propionyl-CoA carboxylase, biotin carboxylase, biotin carboxyl carrier protein
MTALFQTVLVANRGEIAVRVIRTLRALGVRSVAVYSDADADSRHVRDADLAVRLGPAPARESYLCIEQVIEAARRSGAEAIHPGYGFLSENADFVLACTEAGLVFIGPPASAVQIMGDKISAKRTVSAAGVAVVAGRFEPGMTDAELLDAAAEVGYPVLVKPAAGGGGKGMRSVADPAQLPAALVSARREARSAFGDDTLFIERYVSRPRHIEVQVLADSHGNVIHLGERECSLQRRHQKIIEEAPSVLLDPPTRARIGAAAVETACSVGYLGAGTVEFIVSADRPEEFFFLEMNTRLQVEHPVTELVTGIDLVAEQLRVAAGEPLQLSQSQVRLTGHAIEARLYAEDPAGGFLPTGGTVLRLREPDGEPGVRVDSGISEGSRIGTWYDPMLSKVIAWGSDREAALDRLQRALGSTSVLGVRTNLEFLQALLAHPQVRAGRLDTQLVDRELAGLLPAAGRPIPDRTLAAYGLVRLLALEPAGPRVDPWDRPTGWRVGLPRPLLFRVVGPEGGDPVEVRVGGTPGAATVQIGDGASGPASIVMGHRDGDLLVTLDGVTTRWLRAVEPGADQDRLWLARDGETWELGEAVLHTRERASSAGSEIHSPMPGVVLAVHVAAGDLVKPGQPLVVVEAMKMEHTVTAQHKARLTDLFVKVGSQVTLNQLLARTEPDSA